MARRARVLVHGFFGNVAADPDAFRKEIAAAMEEIIAANRGRRVAVFCHGGVINAWGSQVMGTKEVFFFDPTYTSINRFMAAGSGERTRPACGAASGYDGFFPALPLS